MRCMPLNIPAAPAGKCERLRSLNLGIVRFDMGPPIPQKIWQCKCKCC